MTTTNNKVFISVISLQISQALEKLITTYEDSQIEMLVNDLQGLVDEFSCVGCDPVQFKYCLDELQTFMDCYDELTIGEVLIDLNV